MQSYLSGEQELFSRQLLVWNRTAAKADPLVRAGAAAVSSFQGATVPTQNAA